MVGETTEGFALGGADGASEGLGNPAGPFLKLGTLAFSGPAAQIAILDDEMVRRRGWLTREQVLDLLGAANLIPGSRSTELAIQILRLNSAWLVPGGALVGVGVKLFG